MSSDPYDEFVEANHAFFISSLGCATELAAGFDSIDGARDKINEGAKLVKKICHKELKKSINALISSLRDSFSSKLQYFINCLLLPYVGFGTTKVCLRYDDPQFEPRNFSVTVMPSEQRRPQDPDSQLTQLSERVKEVLELVDLVREVVTLIAEAKTRLRKKGEKLLVPLID